MSKNALRTLILLIPLVLALYVLVGWLILEGPVMP